jgi:hypothetical protein
MYIDDSADSPLGDPGCLRKKVKTVKIKGFRYIQVRVYRPM